MDKVKLALNYALMIEMIRAEGYTDDDLLAALKKEDPTVFQHIDEGIPDWETMIDFARNNWEKLEQAVRHGYQITFLTFGALRSLLRIKFNLLQEEDYQMGQGYLEGAVLSEKDLELLKSMIAMNWTIIEQASDSENQKKTIRIELSQRV